MNSKQRGTQARQPISKAAQSTKSPKPVVEQQKTPVLAQPEPKPIE